MRLKDFWQHVDIPTGEGAGNACWPWTGAKRGHGYGHVRLCDGVGYGVHRVAYELIVGPIPEGLYILHECDNPICVNPAHLRPGTQADNMRDAGMRGRMPRGEANARSKLTDDAVRHIRQSSCGNAELARLYRVANSLISEIRTGRRGRWAHVQ